MNRILEDDVLDVAAVSLRAKGFQVLSCGGNQDGAFNYFLPSGRRKVPDLVAYCDSMLLVCEGKIKVRDLFVGAKEDFSDYESTIFLVGSKTAQTYISDKAKQLLTLLKVPIPSQLQMVGGLIASGACLEYRLADPRLALFCVNMNTLTMKECGAHGYLLG